jgi:hypothetical protein
MQCFQWLALFSYNILDVVRIWFVNDSYYWQCNASHNILPKITKKMSIVVIFGQLDKILHSCIVTSNQLHRANNCVQCVFILYTTLIYLYNQTSYNHFVRDINDINGFSFITFSLIIYYWHLVYVLYLLYMYDILIMTLNI